MPVDTSHAIGQYARFVLRESESHNEILNGTVPTGDAGSTGSTSGGLAFIPGSGWTSWARDIPDIDPVVSGSFSIFWYGETVAHDTTFFGAYTNGYGWILEQTPWEPGKALIRLRANYWGNSTGFVIWNTTGTMRKFGLDWNSATNQLDFYLDGVLQESKTWFKDSSAVPSPASFAMSNQSASLPSKVVTLQVFDGMRGSAGHAALAADPFAIFVATGRNGTVASTDAADTLAAAGTVSGVGATVASTDAADTLAATGTVLVRATVATTDATDTLAATGLPSTGGPIAGAVDTTDASDTLATTGKVLVRGSVDVTDANDTLTAGTYDPYDRLRGVLAPLPLHTWVKVNLNSFDDVEPAPSDMAPIPGNHRSVIYAWSSFAWDHTNGNLILFGGGHANYKGNEIYIWSGHTGLWSLGSLPSKIDEADTALMPVISKDAPQSSHTYQNNVWLKNQGMFVTFGGAATPSGGPFQELVTAVPKVSRRVGPWVFDLSKADGNKVGGATGTGWDTVDVKEGSSAWQHRRDMVDGSYPIDSVNHVNGAAVAVDEGGTDVVYMTMDNASGLPSWYRYQFGDIRAGGRDTCAQVGGRIQNTLVADGWMAFDTKRGFMYRNGAQTTGNPSYTAEICAMRVAGAMWNTYDTPIQVVDTLGNPFSMNVLDYASSFFGCAYDVTNDVLWLWDAGIEDATKPGRVWYITIPAWDAVAGWASTTWVATEINPTGDTPFGGHNAGVLGKVKHIPELGALVVLDGAQGAWEPGVWMFKTSGETVVESGAKRRRTLSFLGTRSGTRTPL